MLKSLYVVMSNTSLTLYSRRVCLSVCCVIIESQNVKLMEKIVTL